MKVYDIHLNRRNEWMIKEIRDRMGSFLKFDKSDPLCLKGAMKACALVHIDKPV